MKFKVFFAATACAAALWAGGAGAAAPTAKDFARLPTIDSVTISPDGRHIAAITSPDGLQTFVTIWNVDALSEKPVVLGLGAASVRDVQQRFMDVSFVKNDKVAVVVRQVEDLGAFPYHLFRLFLTDVDGKGGWETALGKRDEDAMHTQGILSRLPLDPRHILVETSNGAAIDSFSGVGDETNIYKVDIYSGAREVVLHGSEKYFNEKLDVKGELRAEQTSDFDGGKIYVAQLFRNPGTGKMEEHFRWYAETRESQELAGFEPDSNLVFVRSNKGRDKAAILEYDIAARHLGEPAFETKFFDADSVVQSSAAADYGRVLGFTYAAETTKTYWVDEKFSRLDEALRQALGVKTVPVDWTDIASGEKTKLQIDNGFSVEIDSWSDDRTRAIVVKSGPKASPEYYLYEDGKPLRLLGRSRPQIDAAALGDTRLVEYAARDGLMIPAFVTTPPASFGAGPHPAIVLPHGGPWARDEMSWDPTGWTQYFASRGYVVIQPQFRGSEGWGQKLWRAGDRQWGLKMQDDNDDAAKWLIAQGLADSKRIAIFGYSYGGYAATMGAIRPNGLYQCAVEGAGVASLKMFQDRVFGSRFGREFQRPSMDGVDAIAHAHDISIPILLIHGDRDRNVPVTESKHLDGVLGSKPHRLVVSKDMGHEMNKWQPKDIELMLTEVEKFLKTDCKPGGL